MKIKAIFNKKDARQTSYIRYLERTFPEIITEKHPDMYYVLGGDGAMLHAHSKLGGNIPYFGKGYGTLNFIMNNFDNDFEVIDGLLENEIVPEIFNTIQLKVIIKKKNGKKIIKNAINDIIIGNNVMDWHEFIIDSENKTFNKLLLKGMGICISTPLGSTAFNLNNGGNLLPIDSNLIGITGIVCDHKISELMIPQNIDIKIKSLRHKPIIFIDGVTNTIQLEQGDKIKIRVMKDKFQLAFLDKEQFFSKRTKLIQNKR